VQQAVDVLVFEREEFADQREGGADAFCLPRERRGRRSRTGRRRRRRIRRRTRRRKRRRTKRRRMVSAF